MSIDGFLDVLDRAHNGPVCTVESWDTKIVPETTIRKLKEHGLISVCDRTKPVNTDDGLAKEFFEAAFELAVEVGMLCTNTERVIKVGQDELKNAVKNGPKSFTVGEGRDKVKLVHRKAEDSAMPVLGSPLGIAVTEDIYIRVAEAIAREKLIDILDGPSLITVHRREVLSGTPYETVAGRMEAEYQRQALTRAGRPGMSAASVISSVTDLAQFTGYGTIGSKVPNKDLALVLSPAELKTNYATLNKVAHATCLGGRIRSGTCTFIGGYAGPPEGAVLVAIASSLLRLIVHKGSTNSTQIMDSRYMGNAGPEAIWASSMAVQSISNCTNLVTLAIPDQTAGPDTEMLLYETAAIMMSLAVSGASYVNGPRSAGGRRTNHLTPLECRFSGEMLKECRKTRRSAVNEILRELIPRYEPLLGKAPTGRSVLECYDLAKLRPNEEWTGKYSRIKKFLSDLGVTLA